MKASDIDDRHVIELAAQWHAAPMSTTGVVQALINEGVPGKLAVHKVVRLSGNRLLDYGTSPNYAWPTPDGLALLDTPTSSA